MQQTIISGTVQLPERKRQKQQPEKRAEFMHGMQSTKDTGEVQKVNPKSVPAEMLPMVF